MDACTRWAVLKPRSEGAKPAKAGSQRRAFTNLL
jgi:hypothetical protein